MKKQAFTLIELMAVILIIGILMGLVSALIPQLRERARRTQCANNLRQFGLAVESYASDNNSQYPFGGSSALDNDTIYEVILNNGVGNYIKGDSTKIWSCPSYHAVTSSQHTSFHCCPWSVEPNLVTETFVMAYDASRNMSIGATVPSTISSSDENHCKPVFFKNILYGDNSVRSKSGTSTRFPLGTPRIINKDLTSYADDWYWTY